MTRFFGAVGYGVQEESVPGVWTDVIVARNYYGDVLRTTSRLTEDGNLNKDISVNNSISIVADAFAFQNFSTIKYVVWMGVFWTVDSVNVQSPRLILSLGEVYNGKKAPTSGSSD